MSAASAGLGMFADVSATAAEQAVPRAGDGLVDPADVVMDRAFTVDATPGTVWPWLVQLGKRRAGWYLPRRVERFVPPSRRAARVVDPTWSHLRVGDIVPDYGGRHETFQVAEIAAPTVLVYRSRRGRTELTWSITAEPVPTEAPDAPARTRVFLRLRLAPVRRRWLAETAGEFVDQLTVAGLAAGLRERLTNRTPD
jgi:hypothetical protein